MDLIELSRIIERSWQELEKSSKDVAIVFIDLADSTACKEQLGIEMGLQKIVNFTLAVTRIIKEKAGEEESKKSIDGHVICKYIGDEVMAYFYGQDSAEVAIRTALLVQQFFESKNKGYRLEVAKFRPKIGIDWGQVWFAKYSAHLPDDPYGLIVDRAARITSLTQPQQILVSEVVKTKTGHIDDIKFSGPEERSLRGLPEKTRIYEIVWSDRPIGIKAEEDPPLVLIPADRTSIDQFMRNEEILSKSTKIDLMLYTAETVLSFLRNDLRAVKDPLKFRLLVRNPSKEETNKQNIIAEIHGLSQIMSTYPSIRFDIRFYDDEPMLRLYLFHTADNQIQGLVGMYYHEPSNPRGFVGAENNDMIHCRSRSPFEVRLLTRCRSRFEYLWQKFTKEKAVIFDLDGVLVDSMPNYVRAWQGAFATFGLEISERDVYMREGEKREETVTSVHKQYRGAEPTQDEVALILAKMEEIYKEQPKPVIVAGIAELLVLLKDKGIKLGLVTGSSREMFEKTWLGDSIFSLFDKVVTGSDTQKGKPAPDPYDMAVRELEIPKESCLAIENATLGVKSARAARLRCFGVLGSSPLSAKDLESAGAIRVEKNIEALRRYLLWADTNVELKDLIDFI